MYDFFASIGSGWVNLATIIGAIIGICISISAIYFSKKLSDESNKVADAIRANTEASYRLHIGGMGHQRLFTGDRTAENMTVFPRIKD
jgi:hypothetical protein